MNIEIILKEILHKLLSYNGSPVRSLQVLDEEVHVSRCLISEMIYIKKQKMGLNVHRYTELHDPIYYDLIR